MMSESVLPQAPAGASVLSVSQLNQAVARLLERSFALTWISGEVSNFTRAASGHWYFTLKDDGAQVRAVMFRGRAQYADFLPREGDRVEVRALVSLYAARGDYQLGVEAIRRAGVGNLYEAFLQLKARLAAEGLFDGDRKRPVPAFARCIGIVTSPQAAALHDVLTALQRRAPHCCVILYPAPVQGPGAGEKIASAIATASARCECEVLLVCRGGGSIEDLWAFNHEAVARAIVAASMPVIAGIGHETDVTIADFAADLRAPTPTAAAELATRPRHEWLQQIDASAHALHTAWRRQQSERCQSLDWLSRRVRSPAAVISHQRLRLMALQQRLQHATRIPATAARHRLAQLGMRLATRLPDTTADHLHLRAQARRMDNAMHATHQRQRQALAALAAQLELLNPERTLERGYAILSDARGTIVRNPNQLQARATITVRLAEGSAEIGIATVQTGID
jgi:exodeoxyribonuclease VII large subunit